MTLKKIWFVFKLCFIFVPGAFNLGVIDVDEIRDGAIIHVTNLVDCQSLIYRVYCAQTCHKMKILCNREQCYCQKDVESLEGASSEVESSSEESLEVWKPESAAGILDHGSIERSPDVWKPKINNQLSYKNTVIEKTPKDLLFSLRPTLRHHIAHFCPNLAIARQCIRECMKQGKPAFCGKDHVCYCGHKYSSHDVNKKVKVSDVYSQFKDLYEKYLGSQYYEDAEKLKHYKDVNNET